MARFSVPPTGQLNRALVALAEVIAAAPDLPWKDLAVAAAVVNAGSHPYLEAHQQFLDQHPQARGRRVRASLAIAGRAFVALDDEEAAEGGRLIDAAEDAAAAPELDERAGLLEAINGYRQRVAAIRSARQLIEQRARLHRARKAS